RRSSAGVLAHEFPLRQAMALNSLFHILLGGAWGEIQFGIKRVKLEKVTVRLSGWWTRSTITQRAKIVPTLARTIRKLVRFAHVFRQLRDVGGNVVKNPMRPGAGGGIRIIRNQSETLGVGWRSTPRKGRRYVSTVTGELLGNVATISKGGAGNREVHFSGSRLPEGMFGDQGI